MSTHVKVGCKGSTLHGHVCVIGIFELMVNLSTENALHCIVVLFFLDICTSSPKGNDAHLRALGSRYYACP